MKREKKIWFTRTLVVVFFILSVSFILIACGGIGRKLSGTWVSMDRDEWYSYEFSDKSCTFTETSGIGTLRSFDDFEDIAERWIDELKIKGYSISGTKDTIKAEKGGYGYSLSFFENTYKDKVWSKATFSISGDKIEFVTDGQIQVFPFSRTKNTITIDGRQYKKKR